MSLNFQSAINLHLHRVYLDLTSNILPLVTCHYTLLLQVFPSLELSEMVFWENAYFDLKLLDREFSTSPREFRLCVATHRRG